MCRMRVTISAWIRSSSIIVPRPLPRQAMVGRRVGFRPAIPEKCLENRCPTAAISRRSRSIRTHLASFRLDCWPQREPTETRASRDRHEVQFGQFLLRLACALRSPCVATEGQMIILYWLLGLEAFGSVFRAVAVSVKYPTRPGRCPSRAARGGRLAATDRAASAKRRSWVKSEVIKDPSDAQVRTFTST